MRAMRLMCVGGSSCKSMVYNTPPLCDTVQVKAVFALEANTGVGAVRRRLGFSVVRCVRCVPSCYSEWVGVRAIRWSIIRRRCACGELVIFHDKLLADRARTVCVL